MLEVASLLRKLSCNFYIFWLLSSNKKYVFSHLDLSVGDMEGCAGRQREDFHQLRLRRSVLYFYLEKRKIINGQNWT